MGGTPLSRGSFVYLPISHPDSRLVLSRGPGFTVLSAGGQMVW